MAERWKTNKRTVWNISYHIIRCPKYRRSIIVDNVETRLKELLLEKAEEIDVEIDTMETMPDHVHLFIKAKPHQSPAYIVHQLK
jgi:putative transposase